MEITGISADEALLIDTALTQYIEAEYLKEPPSRMERFRAIRRRIVQLTPEVSDQTTPRKLTGETLTPFKRSVGKPGGTMVDQSERDRRKVAKLTRTNSPRVWP